VNSGKGLRSRKSLGGISFQRQDFTHECFTSLNAKKINDSSLNIFSFVIGGFPCFLFVFRLIKQSQKFTIVKYNDYDVVRNQGKYQ